MSNTKRILTNLVKVQQKIQKKYIYIYNQPLGTYLYLYIDTDYGGETIENMIEEIIKKKIPLQFHLLHWEEALIKIFFKRTLLR